MDVTTMSEQLLIDELLGINRHGPVPADFAPSVCETRRPAEIHYPPHLRRILEIARELLVRNLRNDWQYQPLMASPATFREWVRMRCAHLEHEVFLVVFLDAHLRLIDVETMFRGTLTQTSVYPREVIKSVLARNAAAVAFVHNHPSGSALPSRADEVLTQTLKTALALVDVRCVDHFIVAGGDLLSMAERGLM
ncbi:DNA repair protein RadC [Achromobacter pulmonis]|uniref:DNA repair protein RadC n=1 Tax=Achromobacter pulmonis TaxID=1389932 RepID=A0A2N8KK49_9BURK|nr:JAB domain-containing protein [Achromobacter pulmonis]PND33827.1 DNA repair protein RadC [Achromobacter pulmonis]